MGGPGFAHDAGLKREKKKKCLLAVACLGDVGRDVVIMCGAACHLHLSAYLLESRSRM